MLVRRAYVYRLYPTQAQAEALTWTLDRCRELYNACLQERREAYRLAGVSVSYYDQKRQLPEVKSVRPEYRRIGSQVLQDVVQRVDRAFAAFFRRLKVGGKAGFPRFKNRDRYHSFTLTQAGWKLDTRLHLIGIGDLKVKWSRSLEGTIKTVTIRRDADQWYVSFSCLVDRVESVLDSPRPAIGIDLGLEHFLTTSAGDHVANPRHLRVGETLLTRRQRALAHKRRGSKRRKKARLLVAKAHRKVRNQRRDFHHKTARTLVNGHRVIAIEALRVANMVKNRTLAKSISDAGWGQFIVILSSKAEGAGCVVMAVHPAGTSQVCSGCGAVCAKTLEDRWHTCDQCGCSLQRDVNAAKNILARAGLALQAGA